MQLLWRKFLYPTQRVAEGILFWPVRQSVSQSDLFFKFVSATPLKPLNRISWNFVVMREQCPLLNFEMWRKWKILLKQLISTTPLKPLNKIAWNFVVMKNIMCRSAFLLEMLIWSFWEAIYIPFSVRLPVSNAWNCHSLYIQHSQAMLERGVCELAHSFFHCSFLRKNIFRRYELLLVGVGVNRI